MAERQVLKVCVDTQDLWLDDKRLYLSGRLTEVLLKLAVARGGTVNFSTIARSLELDERVKDDRHCVWNAMTKIKKALGGKDTIIIRRYLGYVLNLKVVMVNPDEIENLPW